RFNFTPLRVEVAASDDVCSSNRSWLAFVVGSHERGESRKAPPASSALGPPTSDCGTAVGWFAMKSRLIFLLFALAAFANASFALAEETSEQRDAAVGDTLLVKRVNGSFVQGTVTEI